MKTSTFITKILPKNELSITIFTTRIHIPILLILCKYIILYSSTLFQKLNAKRVIGKKYQYFVF